MNAWHRLLWRLSWPWRGLAGRASGDGPPTDYLAARAAIRKRRDIERRLAALEELHRDAILHGEHRG